MFHFRRVFIGHPASDETLSCTKGMTVFRSKKALYGLFVIYNTKDADKERRLYIKVSPMGKPP